MNILEKKTGEAQIARGCGYKLIYPFGMVVVVDIDSGDLLVEFPEGADEQITIKCHTADRCGKIDFVRSKNDQRPQYFEIQFRYEIKLFEIDLADITDRIGGFDRDKTAVKCFAQLSAGGDVVSHFCCTVSGW